METGGFSVTKGSNSAQLDRLKIIAIVFTQAWDLGRWSVKEGLKYERLAAYWRFLYSCHLF